MHEALNCFIIYNINIHSISLIHRLIFLQQVLITPLTRLNPRKFVFTIFFLPCYGILGIASDS